MPVIYVYRCKVCKGVREIEKPHGVTSIPDPLCLDGHGPMTRSFTPLRIKVKGGTPNFHGQSGPYDKGKWREDYQEEENKTKNEEVECAVLREESKKNYYGNGLHHAHGFGSPEDDMTAGKELRAQEKLQSAESK